MKSLLSLKPFSVPRMRAVAIALVAGSLLLGACSSDESATNLELTADGSTVATTAPVGAPEALDSGQPATADGAVPAAAPDSPIANPTGQLADEAAALWQVVDTVDGLNVRAAPGSASAFVGVFAAGETNIRSTGRRAQIDGNEWKEVSFGDGAGFGWVATSYLIPLAPAIEEAAPPAPIPVAADRRECFAGGGAAAGHTIRFDFSADGRSFVAAMRVATGSSVEYFAAAGQKVPPNPFSVTVRSVSSSAERVEQWTFGIDGVELPNGVAVDLTQCGDPAALSGELDAAVSAYPAAPAT